MADSHTWELITVSVCNDVSDIKENNDCVCCSKLKLELEDALQELFSAKKIIELLQEDVNKLGHDIVSTNEVATNFDLGFVTVNNKNRRIKLLPDKCDNNGITKLQQSQPIPVIFNKYAVLNDLQEDFDEPLSKSSIRKAKLERNKYKCPSNMKKRKIIIIGDSHVRGYAAKLSDDLGKHFEVTGSVMPGARTENIVNMTDKEISALGKKDIVIIWGGTHDISKNEKYCSQAFKKVRNQQAKYEYYDRNCPS